MLRPLPSASRTTVVRLTRLFPVAAAFSVALAPGRADGQEPRRGADVRAGATQIADEHQAMHHFYRQLKNIAGGSSEAIARIAVYGESTNASDRVTSSLRRRLQARFGDAGKGFVPVAPGWHYQRHQDVRWRHAGRWRTWVVNRANGPGNRYGLGGVVSESRNRAARAWFGTSERGPSGEAVARFSLFFHAFPEAGAVELRVDGGPPTELDTRSAVPEDRVHHIEVTDGPHELEIRPADDNPHRLYGVVMERNRPGVVVDGLMLVGAFTRVLGHFDADHWARQIALRQTDLLVFWLGGNDATSRTTGFSRNRFVESYVSSIERARRGRPESSCLVVSVMDSADTESERIRTFARVPRVVRAQADVAARTGCAFYNLFEATGGHNTMARWRRRGLASGDFKHLTMRGSSEVGRVLYEAISAGYEHFENGDG